MVLKILAAAVLFVGILRAYRHRRLLRDGSALCATVFTRHLQRILDSPP
jgi:hypothetical protein